MVAEAEERSVSAKELCPRPAILLAGGAVVSGISFVTLTWPASLAATVLGLLMIAGAEVDARTFLLPDTVTGGTLVSGILAAAALDPFAPALGAWQAAARALSTAAALLLVRWLYARLRNRDGIGFGDIKLAAGVGAWLPFEAVPACFALAASAGLIAVLIAHLRGARIAAGTRIPFGAFLCPALWLVFLADQWGG